MSSRHPQQELEVVLRELVPRVGPYRAREGGDRRIGLVHGDFQFAIDPGSRDFLDLGVFSTYTPCDGVEDSSHHLSATDWRDLLTMAHTDKTAAFRRYSEFYLSTDGQRKPCPSY